MRKASKIMKDFIFIEAGMRKGRVYNHIYMWTFQAYIHKMKCDKKNTGLVFHDPMPRFTRREAESDRIALIS
jgi:hypothetical protein